MNIFKILVYPKETFILLKHLRGRGDGMQFESETTNENESLMRRLSRECKDVLVNAFTLAMSDKAEYNAKSTFDILVYVATNKTYVETAVKQLRGGKGIGKNSGIIQSADTVLNRLKGKKPEELLRDGRT